MSIACDDIYSKGDRINAYKTKASIFVAFIHKVKNKGKVFLYYLIADVFLDIATIIFWSHLSSIYQKTICFCLKTGHCKCFEYTLWSNNRQHSLGEIKYARVLFKKLAFMQLRPPHCYLARAKTTPNNITNGSMHKVQRITPPHHHQKARNV